jgi:uncharacterized membrane protein YqjE
MQHDTDAIHAPPAGVFSSVKNFTASFVAHVHTRLQLFATEFAEEQLRLAALLFSALTALFFFFSAMLLATFFVIAAAWDTAYRLYVVGALMLLFLTCAGILSGVVRARLKSKPRLFQASLTELYKDRQQLTSE